MYVRSGGVLARVDDREYHTEGPCLFTIPPSVVHGFDFEKDITLGYVITVSRVMLAEDQISRCSTMHDELMQSPQVIDLEGFPKDQMFLDQTIARLVDEYRQNEPGKQQLLEYLLFSMLIKLGRVLRTPEDQRSTDHYGQRYQKLCSLIEKYYRAHKTCQFYADELCTTPIGLNRACKAISGKSVGDLIQDRLALEAQRMLIYSSAPISLIAYELGFADPAYFSRFFKRRVGTAPSAFREHREQA
ncbi:MAG: helix-turn-helix domain-containing protein [Marinobacter sp.]|nr:helix-turn-helix domain-containing protein [Marinobacter sp.]